MLFSFRPWEASEQLDEDKHKIGLLSWALITNNPFLCQGGFYWYDGPTHDIRYSWEVFQIMDRTYKDNDYDIYANFVFSSFDYCATIGVLSDREWLFPKLIYAWHHGHLEILRILAVGNCHSDGSLLNLIDYLIVVAASQGRHVVVEHFIEGHPTGFNRSVRILQDLKPLNALEHAVLSGSLRTVELLFQSYIRENDNDDIILQFLIPSVYQELILVAARDGDIGRLKTLIYISPSIPLYGRRRDV